MEVLLIIAGVVLLIVNIAMIITFFQIANNLNLLTKFFIDGTKPTFDPELNERNNDAITYFSKNGNIITKEEWLVEKKRDLEYSKNISKD